MELLVIIFFEINLQAPRVVRANCGRTQKEIREHIGLSFPVQRVLTAVLEKNGGIVGFWGGYQAPQAGGYELKLHFSPKTKRV